MLFPIIPPKRITALAKQTSPNIATRMHRREHAVSVPKKLYINSSRRFEILLSLVPLKKSEAQNQRALWETLIAVLEK